MAEGTTTLGKLLCQIEGSIIKNLMGQPLRNGDTQYKSNIVMLTIKKNRTINILSCRYLIDLQWFCLLKKYVGWNQCDSGHVGNLTFYPGCIDLTPLLKGIFIFYQIKIIFHNQLSLSRKHY